jgi:hypothetical protein
MPVFLSINQNQSVMKKVLTVLLVICAIFSFAQQKTDGGGDSRSLSGSSVVFDPGAGGASCFYPNETQDFVFRVESFTTDWEWVQELWLSFPYNWVVNSVSIEGTPTCINGGTFGPFNFFIQDPPNTVFIQHVRYQSPNDMCSAYYKVNVTTGPTMSDAFISWYFKGDPWGNAPHYPCSDDGYTPPGRPPCDESLNPAVIVEVCSTVAEVPINNRALYLGILLIIIIAVIRFKKII